MSNTGPWQTLGSGARAILSNRNILLLGLSCSFFEGAVYTFVFMWVPTLGGLSAEGSENFPFGLVFSCFMVSVTIGGSLYQPALRIMKVCKLAHACLL